jgi:L-iditol 2-dehydrogenase
VKAVFYEAPQKLSFRDVDEPPVHEDTILVRIVYSFICATDIKTYKQGHPQIKPPSILGHEFSGVVERVGSSVTSFHVGDWVTGIPFISCGECEMCLRGRTEACPNRRHPSNGALAELIAFSESYAHTGLAKVPEALALSAALSEPVSCVLNSARAFNPRPGDTVLVVGAGFMGVLNALVIRSLFGARTLITDVNSARLALPQSLGIEPVTDPEALRGKMDAVILTPPIPDLVPQYEGLVAPFGHLVLFGGYAKGSKIQVDPNLVHYKGLRIVGTSGFSPFDFRTAVNVIKSGLVLLEPFTKGLYPFSDFDRAFKDALEGRALKAGFTLQGGQS